MLEDPTERCGKLTSLRYGGASLLALPNVMLCHFQLGGHSWDAHS